MDKNKALRVLSTTAMTSIITAALGTTAYAKTTDILAKDSSGKQYQYSYEDLKNSLMGDKVLFNEFKTRTVVAYKDDKAGYVDFNYLTNQYMEIGKKNFVLDTVTEATPSTNVIVPADTITPRVVNSDGTVKDGTVINNVKTVTSVSISAVSVEEGKTATPVVTVKDQNGNAMASGYTVSYSSSNSAVASVDATTGVITAGAYSSASNTATITATVTPTTGTAVTGTATVTVTADVTKPTIESVQAISSKQIKVVYSEKVTQASAETITNYKLYSVSAGKLYDLVSAGNGAANKVEATAALQADGKTVLINILNTSTNATTYQQANEQAGFALSGLTNSDYVLYPSSIADRAATPNTIVANSNKQFTGTTAPDTIAPSLLTAAYDTGLKQLTLSFDEAPVVTLSKMTIVNGTKQVALTGASSSTTGLTTTITLTADQATALGTLQSDATVQLAAGAVADASTNANTSVITSSITQAVRPEVAASSYDEATNKLTVNFSQAIKTSTVDVSKIKIQWSTDGTNFSDLAAVNTTNYTVGTAGSSSSALEFTLDQTAIDAMGAKRGTTGVTYRIGLQDQAVTNVAGTLANDAGSAGGSDWQYASLAYTKETVAPAIESVNFYTTAKSTTPRYTGDTTGVQANHLYIKFDQKIRPASLLNDNKLTLEYGTTTPKTSVSLTNTAGNITGAVLLADGKTLDVVFATGTETTAIAAGTAEVKVATGTSLTDVNKNSPVEGSKAATYNNNAIAGTVSATMHSATQIKLTQATTNFGGTISASNFTVYTTTNINDVKTIKSVSMVDTNNDNIKDSIFIELSAAPTSPVTVAFTGLTDSIGQNITNTAVSAGALTTDSSAPTLVTSSYTDVDSSSSTSAGDKVTLVFNEPVKAKTTPTIAAAYGTGATIAQGSNANEMVITLGSSPSITFGSTKLEGSSGDMITDMTGTGFNGSATNIPTPTGAAAPVFATNGLVTATDVDGNGKLSAGDRIVIPFDKTISTTPNIDETKFDVERVGSTDTNIDAGTTFTATAEGSNVVLTFNTVAAADATDVSSAWSVAITGSGSNIKSSWGVETAGVTEKNITSPTTNKPYITSAKYNPNTHKLTVVFSEAVNLAAFGGTDPSTVFSVTTGNSLGALTSATVDTGFYLDAADTTNKTVVFLLNGTEAIDNGLTYINAKAGGATGSGVKDFDGNKLSRIDTNGVVIQADSTQTDTTAPTYTITGTSINGAGDNVVITFSEAMDKATLTTAKLQASTNTWLDYSDDAGNTNQANIDLSHATGSWNTAGTVYTITMDEGTDAASIPDGKYLGLTLPTGITDLAGNSLAGGVEVYTAAGIAKETTAPSVSSVVATSVNNAGDTIAVNFDESINTTSLNQAGLRDGSDIVVGYADDAAGTTNFNAFTVTNATAAWSNSNKTFTITLNEGTDGAYIPNGKYVVVKNAGTAVIADLAGNVISGNSAVIGATSSTVAKETTAPTVVAALSYVDATHVDVTFSEAVTQAGAQTVTNYTLSGTGGISGNPSAAALQADKKVVRLTVSDMSGLGVGQTVIVTVGTGVLDLAGNATSASTNVATYTK